MSVSKSSFRDHVEATAGTHLSDEALARVATQCAFVAAALEAQASASLFDTEPAQLATALDACAAPEAS